MKRIIPIVIAFAMVCISGCQQARDPKLPAGADFVLQTADGPLDSKNLRGKVLLVYFGYTNCPDICPASLAAGGQALKALKAEERSKVRLLMISVDPERDTPELLKGYISNVTDRVTGITGDPAKVAELAKAWGVYWKKVPTSDGSYTMDHTALVFLLNSKGQFHGTIAYGENPDTAFAKFQKFAKL